jgi:anti-sigma-K factor RskA
VSGAANSGGHERWEGDAAAYALRSLQEDEVRPFEEHLAGCVQCREEVDAMRQSVDALSLATATIAPPGRLRGRVMATVRAEAARRKRDPQPFQKPKRRGRPAPPATPGWARLTIAVAAAVVAAAVVVALTVGGGRATRTYAGIVYAPGATASLRQSSANAQLEVSRLPAPPAGRLYEVWLKRAGQPLAPTSALFTTSTGSVAVPGNLGGVQAVLVTAEPRPSGSPKPTRPPIIVVRLT